jgi:hypothetical protein
MRQPVMREALHHHGKGLGRPLDLLVHRHAVKAHLDRRDAPAIAQFQPPAR